MKKRKIKQSIYRILMSEMLPYELPLFISNSRFYQIADKLHLVVEDDTVKYGCKLKSPVKQKWADAFITLLNGNSADKNSFNYYINKTDGEKCRELTLVHPYMQLKVLDFYKKYDSLLLNFCSKSHFSIRYPDKRASFIRPKRSMPGAAEDLIDYKANDVPKHYFHYRKYQNINAFYEGREFQRLESKFKYLYKTDIHHCFDEIPIAELPKMLYQTESDVYGENNFAGKFVSLMGQMNAGRIHKDPIKKENTAENRTGSVLIGPEFSRIFAEMFLQRLDVSIERIMSAGYEKYELHRDYECCRYVDDLFFFYNAPKAYAKFYGALNKILNKHRMRINAKKSDNVPTPFINGVTIAKRELRLVVEKMVENRLESVKGILLRKNAGYYDFPLKMKAQYVITDIKTITSKNNIELSNVSAGLLADLHRKLAKVLDRVDSLMDDYRNAEQSRTLDKKGKDIWRGYEMQFVYYFREMIKVLFYLFNNDKRMNTSIRVLSILTMIVSYCQGTLFDETRSSSKSMSGDAKNKIYKSIVDELCFILKHNHIDMTKGLEICNLMLILKSIPENYSICDEIWEAFLGDAFNDYQFDGRVNFLMALSLMMVFGRNEVNAKYKEIVSEWLMSDLDYHKWSVDDTESLMIMINMMTSPYVDKKYKNGVLSHVDDKFKEPLKVIGRGKSPFMQWTEFRLAKACQMKYSAEVY